ncbi:unnamed protein product [Psylliodes chrysocephalus]|uniref:C2H2-type domain-containing protein n=1 Tax=Psylliodes chrysocephalus TaxID=3402493 RepID=A0A9P0DFG1_9CUCU|nr:unnamed protein product [Psylliodes chrysocephala]
MPTFLKNNIKEEILDDDNFDGQELEGKIVDYQFLVRPKQEQIDIKPNPVSLELINEILDSQENNSNNTDVSTETSKPEVVRKNDPKFFCEYCDFKTLRKSNFVRHYKHIHQGVKRTKNLFCKYCDFKTCYKGSFDRHTSIHENKFRYMCSLCDYKSYAKRNLQRHFKTKHTQRDTTFICNICGHGFTSERNYRNHSNRHRNERKFNCDLCSYKARCKSNLDSHKDFVHFKKSIEKTVLCDMCDKKFVTQQYLNIHLFTVHGKNVGIKEYICYICGYKNVRKTAFLKHVTRHSKHLEKMYCANCDYSTFNKTNLIQHMVKHNKHVKMHKCKICSFETKRPHTLRTHVKSHQNL